jgi:hypothetical protein
MMLRRLLVSAALLALALPALAYIEALSSFKGVHKESDVIARGVIDAVSAEKKVIIIKIQKNIKGKCAYEKIKIDLNAGPEWHPDVVLRHATVGSAVSVFYQKAKDSDKAALSLIYLNRFFMTAQPEDVMWRLGKIELAMSKVYCGTAEEMLDLASKVHLGKAKPPEPSPTLKAFTRDILEALPPPPKEGEKWADFDAEKVLKAQ